MTRVTPIVPAAEIAARRAVDPPALHLPDASVLFARRAERLEHLARTDSAAPMAPYLGLVARLARAQQQALDAALADVRVPDPAALRRARDHAMPPLGNDAPRDPAWRAGLARIVAALRVGAEGPLADVLGRLAKAAPDALEVEADRILQQRETGLDRATAVFIAAALQVHWTAQAARLGPDAFGALDVPHLCPCCGSRPVASVMRDTPAGRHRYLVCTLCAAEWYFVRIKCPACDAAEGIEYFHREGGSQAVKAETCPHCMSYTKIFHPEHDLALEPVADDLATLDLDVALAASTEFHRATLNLAFFPGEETEPDTV